MALSKKKKTSKKSSGTKKDNALGYKKVVIVESPTKAKTLTGMLPGWLIIASFGHVRDLPKSELGIDTEHDFKPKYIVPRDKKKKVNELKKILDASRNIYLATDPDREGEAIAWHISQLIDNTADKDIKRVAFHEITREAIEESFKNPRFVDIPLVHSQEARRVLDRLFGYKLSPLLWKKVKTGLSAGRVQSVTVRLIVEREQEIRNFKPREYWNLTAAFETEAKESFTTKLVKKNDTTASLPNKETVDKVLADLSAMNHMVSRVEMETIFRNPPPPFMTSTLQRFTSSNYGFSAKRTMQAAQSLYEQGFITYMRTDSLNLADSFLLNTQKHIIERYGKSYAPEKPRRFKSRIKVAQEAHEAIRPTDPFKTEDSLKDQLSHDEQVVYSAIWKRAVASQMNPVVFDQRTVDVKSAKSTNDKDTYLFRAVGRNMKFDGYFVLYPQKEKEEEEKEEEFSALPDVHENQQVSLKELFPQQKFTEPPARYTEGTLIKTLEEYGIGRPSTYAPIISTIQDRYYVEKEENKFHPTSIGEAVNEFLLEHFSNLLEYEFTANLEEELDEVARNKEKWVDLVRNFYVPFAKTLEAVSESAEKVELELEKTDEVCEKCGKPMVVRIGRFGKFLACSGFPECKTTKPIIKETNITCPKCGGMLVLKKTRKGRTFFGCGNYPTCDFASWRKPVVKGADTESNEQQAAEPTNP